MQDHTRSTRESARHGQPGRYCAGSWQPTVVPATRCLVHSFPDPRASYAFIPSIPLLSDHSHPSFLKVAQERPLFPVCRNREHGPLAALPILGSRAAVDERPSGQLQPQGCDYGQSHAAVALKEEAGWPSVGFQQTSRQLPHLALWED